MGTQLIKPSRPDDPRHLMRYLKSEAGMTPASIAKSEGVSTEAVKASVRMIERYRAMNSTQEMDIAIRNLVVSVVPKAKETIQYLLKATEQIQVDDPLTGQKKLKTIADKTARIEGLRIVADIIGKVQPKAPVAEVNVNQTMQLANLSSAETPEERFRRLRKQAQEYNVLPPEVAAVPRSIDQGLGEEDEEGEEEEEKEDGDEEEEEEKQEGP